MSRTEQLILAIVAILIGLGPIGNASGQTPETGKPAEIKAAEEQPSEITPFIFFGLGREKQTGVQVPGWTGSGSIPVGIGITVGIKNQWVAGAHFRGQVWGDRVKYNLGPTPVGAADRTSMFAGVGANFMPESAVHPTVALGIINREYSPDNVLSGRGSIDSSKTQGALILGLIAEKKKVTFGPVQFESIGARGEVLLKGCDKVDVKVGPALVTTMKGSACAEAFGGIQATFH
jgi:hypothetical protein